MFINVKKIFAVSSILFIQLGFNPSVSANAEVCQSRTFSTFETTIMQTYIAYYGRPAEPGGLGYWSTRLENENGNLNSIIDAFGYSDEFDTRFGSMSNQELVTNIYQQLFGRDPDNDGLEWYVDELEAGRKTLQTIALDVLYGAQNTDAEVVDNRLSLSRYYVTGNENGDLIELESTESSMFIDAVDDTVASLSTACESLAVAAKPVDNDMPLVERGGLYFNQPEQFNRYYTDKDYMPQRTLYVSPFGENADLQTNSREAPASVSTAFANVQAGDQIYFLRNQQAYQGCYGLSLEQSGTYDDPIVLFAERNDDDTRGVKIECCESGRQSCINLEGANYIAIDGFELEGGHYGVRAVGLNYDSLSHQKGVAVINTEAHDNCKDPFFTGQSDWAVFENNIGHGAGSCDGHGIYISNGSDWNIVRNNELYENASSDFQINADPELTCVYSGIEYDDPQCDGPAELGQGRGASDYMHIEGNYFHNGYSQGPNFTSVRYSMVTHNIIGLYARHGTSFWQETSNPNLGSSENTIQDNLFIGENRRHVLQFINNSDRNEIKNNIFLGVSIDGSDVSVNRSTVLLDVDASVADNSYSGNYYISGQFDGYSPNGSEFSLDEFDPGWFTTFPYDRMGSTADWTPTESAPFGGFGGWSPPVSE